MPLKVYVETSVIGAYFEERSDVVSAAQRHWSCLWWDYISSKYDMIVSEAVINELSDPDFQYSQSALSLVDRVPQVEIGNEVRDIVNTYITSTSRENSCHRDPLEMPYTWHLLRTTNAITC